MKKHVNLTRGALAVIEADGTSAEGGISCRVNAIVSRYGVLLGAIPAPDLTDNELDAVLDAHWAHGFVDAGTDHALHLHVRQALQDGLAEKWHIDGECLLARLENLSVLERIKLIEILEARKAG